jgi:flagellar biogenesis protein FliO
MEMVWQMLPVLFVLGLVLAFAALVKGRLPSVSGSGFRLKASTVDRKMEIIERLYLTPQASVHLVRMGDRQVYLGVSPTGVRLLRSEPLNFTLPDQESP